MLPQDRPQDRHRQAWALGDPTHADTGTAAERGVFLLKSAPTDENVADLMTKLLAAARAAVDADHFDVHTDRVVTVSFTNAARAASPRAAGAMEEATHTSRAALRPGTAAEVRISAGLDCEAVSPLDSVQMPGSTSFSRRPRRQHTHRAPAWLQRC